MARSYSTGSRGADKVRASATPNDPSKSPAIEPFIEGRLGLTTQQVKDFAGAEIFDSASDTEFTSPSGAKYRVNFDLRFAMTDVEDGEEGEKEPTLVKYSISSVEQVLKYNLGGTQVEFEYRPVASVSVPALVGGNEASIRDAVDAEFQKSMVEAGNYNLAKRVGKLAG